MTEGGRGARCALEPFRTTSLVFETQTGCFFQVGEGCLEVRLRWLCSCSRSLHGYRCTAVDSPQMLLRPKSDCWTLAAERFFYRYDIKYGAAVGPPTVTNYGPGMTGSIWTRKFASGAVAKVNCPPTTSGRFVGWCQGNVTAPALVSS
jgi:hypothetical protein